MLRAEWAQRRLNFNFEARTSRAVMLHKDTYYIRVWHEETPAVYGIGECALFKGLSREDDARFEARLDHLCRNINEASANPHTVHDSSLRFGLETALNDLHNGGRGVIFPPSEWLRSTTSIPINGLVWMGDKETMLHRMREKLDDGFRCIKIKIGGIDFDQELDILKTLRKSFGPDDVEIRLDANGAFTAENALARLEALSAFHIHSIEQPRKPGQYDAMTRICAESPIPVALDEELIGTTSLEFKLQLIRQLKPAYIILKPSLCGGFSDANLWVDVAVKYGCGWWATSALESSIGLNAIAQWVARKDMHGLPQGLGTGALYTNNLPSQTSVTDCGLRFLTDAKRASWEEVTGA